MSKTERRSMNPASHILEHVEIIAGDLSLIRRNMAGAQRILDVGAGPATFVHMAREIGYDAVALDIEPSAALIWRGAQIPGVLGDGFRLPFRSRTFEVVRIKDVIEHVEDPRGLLLAIRRVLTPSGYVIAHVPSPFSQFYPVANFWDDYTHVRPLTRAGIHRLFVDAGFRVTHLRGYVAGRNAFERAAGAVIGRFAPHTYLVIAKVEE